MKPANFPGRKHARKLRANARANNLPEPRTDLTVADITIRAGAAQRDAVTGASRFKEEQP